MIKTNAIQCMNTECNAYKFNIPLDQVFLSVMDSESPIVNGKKLNVAEQKTLAVCLWTWMKQNAPNSKGNAVRKAIEERWPDCNWNRNKHNN